MTEPTEPTEPAESESEVQYFEGTITKIVERENPDTGETESIEVMSDNLYPGEKLKRVADEEAAQAKADEAKAAAETPAPAK